MCQQDIPCVKEQKFETLADGLEHILPKIRAVFATMTGSLGNADNIVRDYLIELISHNTNQRPEPIESVILEHLFDFCGAHPDYQFSPQLECIYCDDGGKRLYETFVRLDDEPTLESSLSA